MKILLILSAIYVYFVVGYLLNEFNNRHFGWDDCETTKFFYAVLAPVALGIAIVACILKLNLHKIKLPTIPFTPKKVADLICKIDFSKLVNFRIRIEPKKAEKPDCFGDLLGGNLSAERCCDDCPVVSECTHETHLTVHRNYEKSLGKSPEVEITEETLINYRNESGGCFGGAKENCKINCEMCRVCEKYTKRKV